MIPAGAAMLLRGHAQRRLGPAALELLEQDPDVERVVYFDTGREVWAEVHWYCAYRDGMAIRHEVWRYGTWRRA